MTGGISLPLPFGPKNFPTAGGSLLSPNGENPVRGGKCADIVESKKYPLPFVARGEMTPFDRPSMYPTGLIWQEYGVVVK